MAAVNKTTKKGCGFKNLFMELLYSMLSAMRNNNKYMLIFKDILELHEKALIISSSSLS